MPGPWRRVRGPERVFATRVFAVEQHTLESPRTGEHLEFYVLACNDWCNIVPITAAGEVVMVRQHRYGTAEETLELPGGMIDASDPSPAEAARRELLEETGYEAREVTFTGVIAPNPAMQANRTWSYLARDVVKMREPQMDGGEDITVELVPLAEIPDRVARGEISHALVVVAFAYALGLRDPR